MTTNAEIGTLNDQLADAEAELDAATKALAVAEARKANAAQLVIDTAAALETALCATREERKEKDKSSRSKKTSS